MVSPSITLVTTPKSGCAQATQDAPIGALKYSAQSTKRAEPARTGSRVISNTVWVVLIATLAVSAAESRAQPGRTPSNQEPPGTELDTVTVEARRRRERIEREVSEFVVSAVGTAQVEALERWKVPICNVTLGLTEAQADFVEKRVAQIAQDAGVPLADTDCAANFVVVVTPDPKKLLKEWWSEDHDLFNRDRGLGGVNRMIETDRPVRVWHNACNIPPLRGYYQPSGVLNCNTGVIGTRLTRSSIRAIYSAIVVVDIDYIEGLTFGQLADYAAMVGLTKIRPNPGLGQALTVLGLFAASEEARAKGLTTWDQVYYWL